MKSVRLALLMSLFVSLCATTSAQKLTVGSDAPPLKVEKWLKSTPIDRFQKGKFYVVDFWATWCFPCRQSIPHLTELAKKYAGRVIFAGVSVGETQRTPTDLSYVDFVRKFVTKQGTKMDYHVAVDRADGIMASSWMDASGEGGLPTAFVIDATGKIAWIGNPLMGLDGALARLVPTSQIKSTQRNSTQGKMAQGEMAPGEKTQIGGASDLSDPQSNGSMAALATAIETQDWKAAVTTCNVIFANDPKQELQFGVMKFLALLQLDEPHAYSYAKKLANGPYKASASQLCTLAQMILSETYGPKKPDLALSLDLAKRSVELTHSDDPQMLDTLAQAQLRSGDPDKALETEQRALKLLADSKKLAPEVVENIRTTISQHMKLILAKKSEQG